MDFDLIQFRNKFIEDATELLIKLETDILALENNKTDKELIESVFRAMHTLKGVTSMYGFDKITEFTHSLESIYDAIRNKEFPLSQEIFDITFQSVDHIKNLLDDVDFTAEKNQKLQTKLLGQIKEILSSNNMNFQKKTAHSNQKKEETKENTNKNTFYILLRSSESLINRGIRILNIFEELSEIGKYRILDKIKLTETKKVKEEFWPIFLCTKAKLEKIEDVFIFVTEDCSISKISNFDIFDPSADFSKIINFGKEEKKQENSILESANFYNKLEEEDYKNHLQKDNNTKENNSFAISQKQSNTTNRISIDTNKLDHLMYMVGELITVNSQLNLSTRNSNFDIIRPYLEQLDKLSKGFRDTALELRLIPIGGMVFRFQRLIRDLSNQLGKEIDFKIEGADIELDKNTIDILSEPLMHIIRNSLDHGIQEPDVREKNGKPRKGTLSLQAYHQGNNVIIQIKDDGMGIDSDKIYKKAIEKGFIRAGTQLSKKEIYNLIFLPGLSTSKSLTKISGRGVGMDVVRKKIANVRGEVEINSELGTGTSFTIKLQQSISILDTMLIQVADLYLMIPLSDIEQFNQQKIDEIETRKYTKTLEYQDNLIPFIDLKEIFNLEKETNSELKNYKSIIINKGNKKIALIADRIIGEHQAVLKPLGKTFKNQKLFSSASVLAGGEMAFMLNITELQKTVKEHKVN